MKRHVSFRCTYGNATSERVTNIQSGGHSFGRKKVQVGKDQAKAQSEKTPTPKTKVGKNQTNNQVLIP